MMAKKVRMNPVPGSKSAPMVKPLRLAWTPKDNITALEVAKGLTIILNAMNRPIFQKDFDQFAPEVQRHFEILPEPKPRFNKEKQGDEEAQPEK